MNFENLLMPERRIEAIEEDIHSAIAAGERAHHYDGLAAGYDLIIGNPIYNRLFWGNWPADYRRLCAEAIASGDGPYLDAGCGTLVFSAEVYRHSTRPMVLLDRSLGMLRKARRRLHGLCGRVPENILLLQGDLFQLPFRSGSFATVASFGTLHLFPQLAPLLRELNRVGQSGGTMYLSSLVRERGIGRYYYDLLVRSGEVAEPCDSEQLKQALMAEGIEAEFGSRGNMCSIRIPIHNSAVPDL